MDNQSLSHSCYNCMYHIEFIPKYRRKVMFEDLRREVREAISKVCKMEGVTIIKAAMLPDHVHMYVSNCKTIGNVNEATIKKYIGEQYESDRLEEEL